VSAQLAKISTLVVVGVAGLSVGVAVVGAAGASSPRTSSGQPSVSVPTLAHLPQVPTHAYDRPRLQSRAQLTTTDATLTAQARLLAIRNVNLGAMPSAHQAEPNNLSSLLAVRTKAVSSIWDPSVAAQHANDLRTALAAAASDLSYVPFRVAALSNVTPQGVWMLSTTDRKVDFLAKVQYVRDGQRAYVSALQQWQVTMRRQTSGQWLLLDVAQISPTGTEG